MIALGVTNLTSRESNQDAAHARKAALTGPVSITDRGRPAQVLLSIDGYHRLTGKGGDIVRYGNTLGRRRCRSRSTQAGR